jgi:dihydroorotase
MKTLIQSARIIDPGSPHHGKKRDLLISSGRIQKIGASIAESAGKVIKAKDLCVSKGWIDLSARFCDPGFEYKENLKSGASAASKGGFRYVTLMPGTHPVADHRGAIENTLRNSGMHGIHFLPVGTLSAKMEGKQLSEMFDMFSAGAVAFSDDKNNVSTEMLSRALEYSSNFGGLVMTFPYDRGINAHGQMHEGALSVSLGMKGIPNVSEEIRVMRDLELLRYHGGRLHFAAISTGKSVELIRKAKRDGLHVTCAVAAHQLMFTDEDLMSFDSNFKVLPPFRTKEERKALIAGIKDGSIDAICSDHTPEDIEHKVREFEDAAFGISSIETTFSTALTALEKYLDVDHIIALFTEGPSRVLGMETQTIDEGNDAHFTIFSTSEKTKFNLSDWRSLSRNNPLIGTELSGKVYEL